MSRRPRLNPALRPVFVLATLLGVALTVLAADNSVTLHLKNGDRLTGSIVTEGDGRVVISNRWTKALTVPFDEIARRETASVAMPLQTTNTIQGAKEALAKQGVVNAPAFRFFRHFKGEAQIGLDLIYNTADQQIYHGRIKLDYEHPYASNPKESFKNNFDYTAEYGRIQQKVNGTNQTAKSSDRMQATDKTAFDVHGRWYAYNLGGVGYDRIKQIALQYEEGPGVGYHLFTRTNFTMNLESGANYQVQDRMESADSRDFFYRLAEDVSWKLNPRTTVTEKFEFFPRVDLSEYRLRLESTLAYELWKNILLNFTVLELYESHPAPDVKPNELQVRSSLGVKF